MDKEKGNRKSSFYWKVLQKDRALLAVSLLFNIISAAAGVFIAIFLQKLVDFAVAGEKRGFTDTIIAAFLYILAYACFYYIYAFLSKKLLLNVTRRLRESVFSGIFRRCYRDFYEVNSADYISALTNDLKLVEDNYLLPLFSITEYTVSFAATLFLLLKLSPMITLILFVSMLIMFLVPGTIGKFLQIKQERLSDQYSKFTARIKDFFSGFEVIQSFNLISHIRKDFDRQNKELSEIKYKADLLFVLNNSASEFLALFSQIITIFVTAYLLLTGHITMGTLLAIIQLSGSFVMPLLMLMQNFPKVQSVVPIMKRMEEMEGYRNNSDSRSDKPEFDDRITVSDLSFSYDEDKPVLKDLTFAIEKGKKYAIVGGSGSGKSTLAKLLLGCYNNYEGRITYDGKDIRNIPSREISTFASMIHQNVYLFDKSIRENVCLYDDYPEEKLEKALISSGVAKFLPETAQQIDTPVGENGASLSGGQRQRIAIARALIRETPLLILDEGTSAIDLQTSNEIEQGLVRNKGLTLITITHKLNEELLKMYDQIIYMDRGRIADLGRYTDMYAAGGDFYQFCTGTE